MRVKRYLLLASLSVSAALVAWIAGSTLMLQAAIMCSTLISLSLVVLEARAVWHGKGSIALETLFVGVAFWFWIEATTLAVGNPPFAVTNRLYPYLSSVFPNDVVAKGVFYVSVFQLFLLLGWVSTIPVRGIRKIAMRYDPPSGFIFDVSALGLVCLGWVPVYLTYSGDFDLIWGAMLSLRSGQAEAGVSPGLWIHGQLFGVFGAAIALVRVLLRSPGSWPIRLLAITLGLPLFALGVGGARFVWGFVVLPALIILLARKEVHASLPQRRMLVALFASLILAVALFQGAARQVGVRQFFLEPEWSQGLVGHEHFSAMLYAVDLVPKHHPYFMEPMAPFFITHYVPRAWWPEKSYPQSWQYYNDTLTAGHAFNVTPSVTGQYHMNWGVFGVVFIGWLLGWFARIGDYWLSSVDIRRQIMSTTLCGAFLVFIFFSFRFFYPLYFAFPLFGFLAYWVISSRPGKVRRYPFRLARGR